MIYFFYKSIFIFLFSLFRKKNKNLNLPEKKHKTIYSVFFHASSVGELEVLSPLIEKCAENKITVHVSIFSPSAKWALEKLYIKLTKLNYSCGYFGYSPDEGRWKEFIERIQPHLFFTDRYEAWPDLWRALSILNIPLFIIGAQTRRSLLLVKNVLKFFGVKLPKLVFLTVDETHVEPLKVQFPNTQIHCIGELRIDRLDERNKNKSVRFLEIQNLIKNLNLDKKVFILGSIWNEDFLKWKPIFKKYKNDFFFILAPHKIEAEFIKNIQSYFQYIGVATVLSSQKDKNSINNFNCALLLDEMGVLADLYSESHAAYIGGGFSSGVHSTLEPAISLVPIACGLKNIHKFPEIKYLSESTQLTLVKNSEEIDIWLKLVLNSNIQKQKILWNQNISEKRGALDKVFSIVQKALVEIGRPSN